MIPDPLYDSKKYYVTADEPVNTYIYRPTAWPIVRLLINTPLTPNHVTLIGLVFGIIAGVFYYYGGHLNYALGAFFFFVASIMDCTDGPLARLRKSESEFGRYFEGIVDYLVGGAVFLGFFLNIYNQGNTENTLGLCIAVMVSIIIHNMGWDYTRTQFFSITRKGVYIPVNSFKYFCQTHIELNYYKSSGPIKIGIYFYYLYHLIEHLFYSSTDPNAGNKVKHYTEEEKKEYFKNYSSIMKLWGWNGGKTHFTFFILCSLFYRIDLILAGILIGFNVLWLVTLTVHKLHFYRSRSRKSL